MKEQRTTCVSRILALPLVALLGVSAMMQSALCQENSAIVEFQGVEEHWAPDRIQLAEAWQTTAGSNDITVAVIDTGVYPSHPLLAGRILEGHNLVDPGEAAIDHHGHGTQIAGIIAAAPLEDGTPIGVAPGVKILPIKVTAEFEFVDVLKVAQAIRMAVDSDVDIICVGLASVNPSTVLQEAVSYAERWGIPIVAPAGNAGAHHLFYPAARPYVIAVGGTTHEDIPQMGTNVCSGIDVAAPSVGVETTFPLGLRARMGCTSAATAIVSGAVALALSVNPALSPDRIRTVLRHAVEPIPVDGFREYFGYGRVDMASLVQRARRGFADAGISSVETFPAILQANRPLKLRARIENAGLVDIGDIRVEVLLDGRLNTGGPYDRVLGS